MHLSVMHQYTRYQRCSLKVQSIYYKPHFAVATLILAHDTSATRTGDRSQNYHPASLPQRKT
jgi:hypothetical protein